MLLRIASSSSAALIVTGGLLLVMAALIAQRDHPRLALRRIEYSPFVFAPPPPPEVLERKRVPEPEPVGEPPPRPRSGTGERGIPVLDPSPGPLDPPADFDRFGFGIADGDLLPIVTVAPHYPPAAERRELEGYVIVAFTVTAGGTVDDVRVTESTHSVFERAAIEAVYKFRFRPRVIGGTPVAVDGVKRRITFILEN